MNNGWVEPKIYDEIAKLIPIVAVDVAVFHGGKILLLKRKMPPKEFIGTWCLPGGGIRMGETPHDTAHRELLEETGIDTDNFIGCVGVVTYFCVEGKQNVGIAFVTKVDALPAVKMDGEHDDFGWFDIHNLPEPINKTMANQIKNCICAYHEHGWLLEPY
jgi:ADP-ribose pyrophosphatase YjhB (NUDIX family)